MTNNRKAIMVTQEEEEALKDAASERFGEPSRITLGGMIYLLSKEAQEASQNQ